MTFLFDRDAAEQSARALFTAVSDRISLLPTGNAPGCTSTGRASAR
ncbi:hypothetical protein BTZ20_2073 [Rhodococcus sp. MTM3W5.2]|nr:hypothetical protein BTZ20_2073 [Rhodococcus sp. MTM3W5.2]